MPRPSAKRPEAVPEPDLGPGQAARLRKARKDRGYSLRDLAAAARVSTVTVQNIERGGKGATGCDVMAKLADALGVKRGWLAFGTDVHEP